jgi:hypothetical protein
MCLYSTARPLSGAIERSGVNLKPARVTSSWQDTAANLFEGAAMRMLLLLAGFAAVIGVAAPAGADSGPDAGFLAALDNAGVTYKSGTFSPFQSLKRRAQ